MVVPNDLVPDVSGIAANADLIQKVYSQRHIFISNARTGFQNTWKDWNRRTEGKGSRWEGGGFPFFFSVTR